MQVLPLVQLQDSAAFDHSVFWGPLLGEAYATARTLAAISAGGAGASEDNQWGEADGFDGSEDVVVRAPVSAHSVVATAQWHTC